MADTIDCAVIGAGVIGLALPTMALYEISIWAVRIIERKRAKAQGDDEEDEAETAGEAT